MKDEELKLEEIEASHTLGQTMSFWVVITDTPICMPR